MKQLLALLLFVPSLCLAQVPDYVPTEGLIAWYNLDGNATDLSDNQLNGTVNGPSTTDDRFGLQGAAHFDGANDYILVPHNDLLDFSNNSMTVSMWVRISALPTGTKEFQTLMKVNGWSHSTVGYQAVIAWNGITSLRAKNGSASTWMESGTIASWDLGTYTHITYSLTDTLCSTYINGELASSGVPTNTIIGTNQEPLILGWNNPLANTGASVAFSGDMDDVGFWDRALTAEEVQTLFLNSEPISGCTDSLACNFQADANVDDGSCVSCEVLASACGEGTVWDTTLLACVGVSAPADTVFIEPEACAPSCGEGTVWDPVNEECIIAIPADLNYDGCVSVNDLLVLLAVHGTCPPYPEWPDEPTDSSNCPPGAFDQLQQDLNGEGWAWLGEYNTAQYFVSTNPISWDNAQSLAVAYGGHLVVIESQDENDWISTSVGDEYVWIGLYQDTSSAEYSEPAGGWAWVNGTEVTYSNWSGIEPNDNIGLSNACQMYSNGLWNDAPGDDFLDGSDGRDIHAVIEFSSACPTPDWTCGDPLTYWDYDYATVLIGDQCWFADNLRTELYSNGDSIPNVSADGDWAELLFGAFCIYANSTLNNEEYGNLYNLNAVQHQSELCPSEWHVPTDAEWSLLEGFIENQDLNSGTALKSTSGWYSNGNGLDNFDFSGLPSGFRGSSSGGFFQLTRTTYFWSSTPGPAGAWARSLSYQSTDIGRNSWHFQHGFSVRCIKD